MEQQLVFDIDANELQIFTEEVNEHLHTMETGILCLEQGADSDTLNSVFRAAHTLKALAGTVGHHAMAELTHTMETLFDAMRRSEVVPTQGMADTLLAAVDALNTMHDEIITRRSAGIDSAAILARLQTSTQDGARPAAPAVPEATFSLSPEQMAQAEDYQRHGSAILRIELTTNRDAFAPAARLSQAGMALMTIGEIVFQQPTQAELAQCDGRRLEHMQLVLATEAEPQAVEELLSEIYDLAQWQVDAFSTSEPSTPLQRSQESPDRTSPPAATAATPGAGDLRGDRTVRISVDRLDTLMNLVGELITDRNRLLQIEHQMYNEYGRNGPVTALSEMTTHIDRVVDQLQEEVMRARMVPISHLFSKFPRIVRDVARISGKEVNFVIEGEATELDRTLSESIGDPLIHLLRNAVDHGLETPEQREAIGKPRTGSVRLTAAHEEGHIVITVSDDGRGIDAQRIRQSAVKRGLLTQEEIDQMDDDQVLDLIFRPNLSTAEKVTSLSGRGVGLDVVRTNVERLSGSVMVDSTPGEGATFQVTLPLTLAIVETMLIGLRGSVYAIPLATIIESLYLSEVRISTVRGKRTIQWRDSVLPLLDLREFFAHRRSNGTDGIGMKPAVVTVGWGKQRVGLIVDGIIGKQGIVVKSLSSIVGEIPGILGCAILGDGCVALIVDIPGLISAAFHTRRQG